MIEAIEIERNHFVVKSIDPADGKVFQSATAYSEGAAIRLANKWNRLYIIEKMISWLHQRIVALQVNNQDKQLTAAYGLLAKIENPLFSCSSENLCAMIARQENTILFIAPGLKSSQYPYYQRVILDILEFCKEMKGVEA